MLPPCPGAGTVPRRPGTHRPWIEANPWTPCQATSRGKPPVFRSSSRIGRAVAGFALLAALHAGAAPPPDPSPPDLPDPASQALDLSSLLDMDQLVRKLTDRQVVFVGEMHDRYEHHLNQLALIKGLYARHPDLVIGLEFFQQPFQTYLDQYVAGTLSEKDMLRKTEYYSRWRFDYRLYRPILRFARERRIPLIALNLPREITEKVGRQGLESLTPAERAQVPKDLERDDPAYRARLKAVFDQHPGAGERDFERFLSVQVLWDEGMAERAARHFRAHPKGHMVILAGAGHLIHGEGIPRRLLRRVPLASAIVLHASGEPPTPGLADYLLYPRPLELPPAGLLGVQLDMSGQGVTVQGFSPGSLAESAGLKKGDRLLRVAGEPVATYDDIRIALLDRQRGEMVPVEIRRASLLFGEERVRYQVKLF